MNAAQPLTYHYGSTGTRVLSFSVPAILTISPFTLLLASASLLLLPIHSPGRQSRIVAVILVPWYIGTYRRTRAWIWMQARAIVSGKNHD
jgi:hypothetical protein